MVWHILHAAFTMHEITPETQTLGRQLQEYLARVGMSRERLARELKLSKSCIDKMCSGRYSQKTLAVVMARTKFLPSNAYAADNIGGYSKQSWVNYIGDYVMIEHPYPEDGSIWVRKMAIRWVDDFNAGLALEEKGGGEVGRLCIANERPLLIFVKTPVENGRYFALSTMVAERAMKGIKVAVHKIVGNHYAPVVTPVVLRYETDDVKAAFPKPVAVRPGDPRHARLKGELDLVLKDEFGVIAGA